jgi:DNA-binding NtrC family response regulator
MANPTAVIYEDRKAFLVHHLARLHVIAGPDQGITRALGRGRFRVGTGQHNDLVLTDGHVSHEHVEFRVQDHGYLVHDLGSTNGTFFRNARVEEVEVGPGAQVRIGKTTLRLEVGTETSEEIVACEVFGKLVGTSAAMQEIYGILAAVAPTDATVLIEGETGTGKEVIAEALHRESPRSDSMLCVVDCGSISSNLIESDLFGHERGAFTGAVRSRTGAFERARGGTLFLDEIGELPLELQPRLLRALDRREVKRVGGDFPRKADVRLVAATNRNLAELVKQGRFRDDLYYRLAVIRIYLPPLRERGEDIPLLARHFLRQAGCADIERILTRELLELLESRQWRGNVRELRNLIERVVVMADDDLLLEPEDLAAHPEELEEEDPFQLQAAGSWLARALPSGFLERRYKEAKRELLSSFESLYLGRLLALHGQNLTRIAQEAGVDRQIIRRMLRRHRTD